MCKELCKGDASLYISYLDSSLGAIVRAWIACGGEENSSPDFCHIFSAELPVFGIQIVLGFSLLHNNKTIMCYIGFPVLGFSADICPKITVIFLCVCFIFLSYFLQRFYGENCSCDFIRCLS